jgi:hypothetical protein
MRVRISSLGPQSTTLSEKCFVLRWLIIIFGEGVGTTIGYKGFSKLWETESERERESQLGAGRLLLADSCCRPSLGEGDNKSRNVIDRETMFNA